MWSVELSDDLYQRAVRKYGDKPGLTFLHGSSADVLTGLADTIDEPVIFWLDAHGGMADMGFDTVFNPAGEATQCPLLQELKAARSFRHWSKSCVLIDDARGFLGPFPEQRASDWPSLLEITDLLREGSDRYITILDDVLIAVPMVLRDVIDRWWLEQTRTREGRDGFQQNLWEAYNPKPRVAFRMLVKSLAPMSVRKVYERVR
ncbi:MAG: hypothetical protein M3083_21755 [Actinomycetota bacterium]|nr:hypothetical protein [Actinomycetota bacterium]MDQ6947284.1 hypothetical protein [Actinomycetota bacterium]